jgi:6-phosphogluconolactonase
MKMIRVFNDYEGLSQGAAKVFVELADQAITRSGRFSVVLSGGYTPRRMYEILSAEPFRQKVSWDAIQVFWSDERCVPADDPRSNVRMVRQTLLRDVPVPASHIHTIHGGLPGALAALQYETELRNFFRGYPPRFDLVLLGLGENAHTASLFPHTPVLDEREHWVEDVYVVEEGMHRVTLTVPLINQASQVIFLVSGAEKAAVLQEVLEGMYRPHELPAQLIHPTGAHPIWLVDKAAAHKLVPETVEPA